jgi:cyclopropane fatty-acyl-phospholipid synthase-like methyltransferase
VQSFTRMLVVAVLVVTFHPLGWAQETIPFVPSPPHVVEKMIEAAQIKKGDILYDMGSGDGRIVIEAAKRYGIRGVGIDLNAELVEKARENAKREGVSHLVEFRVQDGLTVDISEATVVTLYMFKWFNNALKPKLQKLKPGSRVIAHDFDIDDWKPTRIEYVKPPTDSSDYAESRTLYIWVVGATPPMP